MRWNNLGLCDWHFHRFRRAAWSLQHDLKKLEWKQWILMTFGTCIKLFAEPCRAAQCIGASLSAPWIFISTPLSINIFTISAWPGMKLCREKNCLLVEEKFISRYWCMFDALTMCPKNRVVQINFHIDIDTIFSSPKLPLYSRCQYDSIRKSR